MAICLHSRSKDNLRAYLSIAVYVHYIIVRTLHEDVLRMLGKKRMPKTAAPKLSTARTSREVGGEDVCRVSKGLGSSPQHLHLLGRLPHIHVLHTTHFLRVSLAHNTKQQSLASAAVQTLSLHTTDFLRIALAQETKQQTLASAVVQTLSLHTTDFLRIPIAQETKQQTLASAVVQTLSLHTTDFLRIPIAQETKQQTLASAVVQTLSLHTTDFLRIPIAQETTQQTLASAVVQTLSLQ